MEFFRRNIRRTRVRLTLAYSAVFLVVAAVLAVAFWLAFQHVEYTSLDDSLAGQARSLLAGLDLTNGRVTFNGNDALPGQSSQGIAIDAVLLDQSGAVIDRSGTGPAPTLPATLAHDVLARGSVAETLTVAGQGVRLLGQRVDIAPGQPGVLVLTRPTAELDRALTEAALLLAAVVVALTLVVSLLGHRLARGALAPVRRMAATAHDISEHDLHRRLSLDLPRDELGELAETFNGMLARLESAFATLQRFTADAAHELRAPLTMLRTEMEVSLRRERTPEEYRNSQRTVLAEVERLSRMADQLLMLARADAGALSPAWSAVDMPDLVEEVVERWQPVAQSRGIALSADMRAEGLADGDPELLRRLLDNLLDNALRHTPGGGSVSVVGTRQETGWTVLVSDTGPGVDPQLRATVFERFTRADAARARDGQNGSAGLGLSLCQAIAEVHGGAIELGDSDGGGATFVVTIPQRRGGAGRQ